MMTQKTQQKPTPWKTIAVQSVWGGGWDQLPRVMLVADADRLHVAGSLERRIVVEKRRTLYQVREK